MKITRKITTEQEIRYLHAKIGVRYWNDCKYSEDGGKTWVDSEDDTDEEGEKFKAKIPFVITEKKEHTGIYNKYVREDSYWVIVIDLEEGKVLDWPQGFAISTNFKVCDDGEYSFLDAEKKLVVNITDEYEQYYVPDFLALEDEGYGDYVYIDICADGTIKHFDLMKSRIESYFSHILDD